MEISRYLTVHSYQVLTLNSFSGADTLVALVAWLVQGRPLQEHVFLRIKITLPGIGRA